MAKRKTHEEFIKDFERLGNKNIIILGNYVDQKTKILVKCLLDGYEWYSYPGDLLCGKGCSVCAGLKVVHGMNDIATVRPDLVKYFVDSNEATKFTVSSNKSIQLRCPDCGEFKTMIVKNLSQRGFECPVCGQTISYPNRLIRSIMRQLKVDYLQYEWSQKWSCLQKYDVYFEINENKYVIEMQGEQHYGAGWNRSKPVDEIVKYDFEKMERAISHDIIPIVIDARISDFDYIFQNIKDSMLSTIFDLSIIDIKKCQEDVMKNIIREICVEYMKNTNVFVNDIAKNYHINRNTTAKYLKLGAKLGWCNYDSKQSFQKARDKVSQSIFVYTIDHDYVGQYKSQSLCARELFKIYNVKFYAANISRAAKSGKLYNNLYFQYA